MDDNETGARPQGGSRSIWLIGGLLAVALLVIAATAVMLNASREDATYPADSPEAVLQDYFRAWQAGDTDAAYAALSSRAQASVPRHEFREAQRWQHESRVRVWIDERTDISNRAVLQLTLEETYEGFLRPVRDSSGSRVLMILEDGNWKIDTPLVGYYAW